MLSVSCVKSTILHELANGCKFLDFDACVSLMIQHLFRLYNLVHLVECFSLSELLACRKLLLPKERLLECHAKDRAKGLSNDQIQQLLVYNVNCKP